MIRSFWFSIVHCTSLKLLTQEGHYFGGILNLMAYCIRTWENHSKFKVVFILLFCIIEIFYISLRVLILLFCKLGWHWMMERNDILGKRVREMPIQLKILGQNRLRIVNRVNTNTLLSIACSMSKYIVFRNLSSLCFFVWLHFKVCRTYTMAFLLFVL